MHDDDTPGDNSPIGKLFEFDPRGENAEPAEYALPAGTPALQDDFDDEIREPGGARCGNRWTRRQILASGGVGLLIGVTGFVGGQSFVEAPRHRQFGRRLSQRDLKRIQAARQWVDAPIDTLVDNAPAYLWVFQVIEPDDTLCRGLERLCRFARLHGGERGYETAATILGTFEETTAPPIFATHRQSLQDLVWRWQAREVRRRRRR